VIVIDDNESIHDDLKKALTPGGGNSSDLDELEAELFGGDEPEGPAAVPALEYDITSAFQGEEGVDIVKSALRMGERFGVAFVDMRMPPGIDGVDTIERIWQIDPDVQVVVCTAYSDYSWEEMVERLGVTDRLLVIKKPFDQSEVCQAAAAMCEKWRLTQHAKMQLDELEQMVDRRTNELRAAKERKAAQEKLRHDALHDPLTSLPNRAMLMERLDQCIRRAEREPGRQYAVVFMDVDNFKDINDSLGHNVGDEVLITVADRLVNCIRGLDTVTRSGDETTARLGGDEFVVLLDDISSASDAIVIAERIREQVQEPITVGETDLVVTVSIGLAIGDGEYGDSGAMLRDADIAMYRAKAHGKAKYAVFNKEMHQDALDRLQLETDLRAAVGTDQFYLLYQPIVRLDTGRMHAVEALMRWNRPEFGTTYPSDFIPIAEERGLIVPMGRWAIEEACRQLREWRDRTEGARNVCVSVNLSKRQIAEPDLVSCVAQALRDHDLSGDSLALEITESGIMENSKMIPKVLSELKDLGVNLYMDDFGTGYSSLSCLHQYPLDVLKVDRSFLDTMAENRDYAAVVYTIMSLAHNLKMKVTAEGVESAEQLSLLQALECDFVQGHYFSVALAPEALEALLRQESPWEISKSA
jgi:diguanylate cyclase (GGDEF)-like protein